MSRETKQIEKPEPIIEDLNIKNEPDKSQTKMGRSEPLTSQNPIQSNPDDENIHINETLKLDHDNMHINKNELSMASLSPINGGADPNMTEIDQKDIDISAIKSDKDLNKTENKHEADDYSFYNEVGAGGSGNGGSKIQNRNESVLKNGR